MGASIFVSHVTESRELASAVKVIVAGDRLAAESIHVAGEEKSLGDWRNELETRLSSSKIVLVLLSPQALRRPWIQIEVGGALMKRATIVPICYNGLHLTDLPVPYSTLTGFELWNDKESLKKTLCDLRDHVYTALGLTNELEKTGLASDTDPIEDDVQSVCCALDKACRSEMSPSYNLYGPSERTNAIVADLEKLSREPNVENKVVWSSAFLSTLAISGQEEFEEGHRDSLLQEKEFLLKLAKRGCQIKLIISPANPDNTRRTDVESGLLRTETLLNFVSEVRPWHRNIGWAISDVSVKNIYVIDDSVCYEGYEFLTGKGYAHTIRHAEPGIVRSVRKLMGDHFEFLRARGLVKWSERADATSEASLDGFYRRAVQRRLIKSRKHLERALASHQEDGI